MTESGGNGAYRGAIDLSQTNPTNTMRTRRYVGEGPVPAVPGAGTDGADLTDRIDVAVTRSTAFIVPDGEYEAVFTGVRAGPVGEFGPSYAVIFRLAGGEYAGTEATVLAPQKTSDGCKFVTVLGVVRGRPFTPGERLTVAALRGARVLLRATTPPDARFAKVTGIEHLAPPPVLPPAPTPIATAPAPTPAQAVPAWPTAQDDSPGQAVDALEEDAGLPPAPAARPGMLVID